MKKVNLRELAWEEWSSPSGKFQAAGKAVSEALGARANAHLRDGGHPFDLELGRLKPGKAVCPFHSHSAQWELYVIVTGEGTMRTGPNRIPVRAGEAVMCPPGDAHQLLNTGAVDLDYLLIADNPPTEFWRYPDSDKWGLRPGGAIFRATPVPYSSGEDEPPVGAPEKLRPLPVDGPSLARHVTIATLREEERASPTGKYRSFVRDVSLALGGVRDVGTWGGGHPFDLQVRRVPPGAAVCPVHAHAIQWELFVVIAGTGTVRSDGETHAIGADDVFLQPPGTAHQIRNTGPDDLLLYVIADNPPADCIHYPDSQKWMIKPGRKVFRMTEVDYFDGEE